MRRKPEDLNTGVDNKLTSISCAIACQDEFHLLFFGGLVQGLPALYLRERIGPSAVVTVGDAEHIRLESGQFDKKRSIGEKRKPVHLIMDGACEQ